MGGGVGSNEAASWTSPVPSTLTGVIRGETPPPFSTTWGSGGGRGLGESRPEGMEGRGAKRGGDSGVKRRCLTFTLQLKCFPTC